MKRIQNTAKNHFAENFVWIKESVSMIRVVSIYLFLGIQTSNPGSKKIILFYTFYHQLDYIYNIHIYIFFISNLFFPSIVLLKKVNFGRKIEAKKEKRKMPITPPPKKNRWFLKTLIFAIPVTITLTIYLACVLQI